MLSHDMVTSLHNENDCKMACQIVVDVSICFKTRILNCISSFGLHLDLYLSKDRLPCENYSMLSPAFLLIT